MLHLLQRTVSPTLSLEREIRDWFQISCLLRESSRKRGTQLENLEDSRALLS
jgi:hypothetical protein